MEVRAMMNNTCSWPSGDPLMISYHDTEWGVPVHDDIKWFEHIVLDGAQAGLSWKTILHRREGYRKAFAGFDPAIVARYGEDKYLELLKDEGIIRNRLKIRSAISNAIAFRKIQEEFGSFDAWIWKFTDGKPVVNHWKSLAGIPARTPLSDLISKELKKRGFSFVGSTICYAFMQAAGLVNDHLVSCFRHPSQQ
ncbi:MAG: DNA-3-methyladenine glycosylase I [Bacteroidales bacterium]|jgi:DNA-3-methyladenine glycosylase I|nr:DNA-3-methyladenine glycosylase I [Bacteroidales bacterium]